MCACLYNYCFSSSEHFNVHFRSLEWMDSVCSQGATLALKPRDDRTSSAQREWFPSCFMSPCPSPFEKVSFRFTLFDNPRWKRSLGNCAEHVGRAIPWRHSGSVSRVSRVPVTYPGCFTREQKRAKLSRANYSAKVLILNYLAISDERGGLNFSAREKMLIFLNSFHSFLVYFAYIQ